MANQQKSLFEQDRLTLQGALELSIASLTEYGRRYRRWSIAYSGGKDSSATVTFVAYAIKRGLVPAPESLTILYADTRQEYPPLHATAMRLLHRLRNDGFDTQVVLPAMDNRFYVYMLGYGVPPPSNRFRWCTPKLKIEPMAAALDAQRGEDKYLSITGVRLGESLARDQRIAVSCSKDSGECGQGWFEVKPPSWAGDTLAPLLHWRLCHVYDWLYFEQHRHGYEEVAGIAAVYGDGDARTGCIGCPLASRDVALERLANTTEWDHLLPLLELKPLFREMKGAQWRKRKLAPERTQDGGYSKNGQRKGPLTMHARAHFLELVLDIQRRVNEAANGRPGVDLINVAEEARIREMWSLDMWPRKWSAADVAADELIPIVRSVGTELIVQPMLFGGDAGNL